MAADRLPDPAGPVLVTGATGMLGRYVVAELAARGHAFVAASRDVCDLADRPAVDRCVRAAAPRAILHLGAETDVDRCEREPGHAGAVNHLATDAIARAAAARGAWMLYISTSNIFGGEGRLTYSELDLPSPMNVYGRAKLHGEYSVQRLLPDNHLILRAGWMIGGGPARDHKFVGQMVRQMRSGAPLVRAVDDKFGTLTSAPTMARYICDALGRHQTGTLHYASPGAISRLDVARAVAERIGYRGAVEAASSTEFPLAAPRPRSVAIESLYLTSGANAPRSWQAELADYLAQFDAQ